MSWWGQVAIAYGSYAAVVIIAMALMHWVGRRR